MPSKYRIILEMASQTARDIASNADRYTDFLITAANNYKYSFKEQLLIHAQKPDATACAEIDTWNKLGRWVAYQRMAGNQLKNFCQCSGTSHLESGSTISIQQNLYFP